jgi:nitrate reductase NapE component
MSSATHYQKPKKEREREEVIGGYILPLTSFMKVGNYNICKWKLQIILFLYKLHI